MDNRDPDQMAEELLQRHGAAATQRVADCFVAAARSGDEDETAFWLRIMLIVKEKLLPPAEDEGAA